MKHLTACLLLGAMLLAGSCGGIVLTTSPAVMGNTLAITVNLPAGWASATGPETVALLHIDGLAAFNSWGESGFWTRAAGATTPAPTSSAKYNPMVIAGEIPSGGAYIALEEITMPADTTAPQTAADRRDLSGLFTAHDWRQDTASAAFIKSFPLGNLNLRLVVACRGDATDDTVKALNDLLQSFGFVIPGISRIDAVAIYQPALQPVAVLSVSDGFRPGETVNPGGPPVEITVKNIGGQPVTVLSAVLDLQQGRTFGFGFTGISAAHPLLPGGSASIRKIIVGPQASITSGVAYPLQIRGLLQDGTVLNYTIPVTFP